RDLLDLVERGAGVLREERAADDVRRAALHRDDGLVRVRLDRAHEHLDLAGRRGRALSELLHLVRDAREAAAAFAGARGLDRRVQREDIRLLGDLLDELDDIADLLRALAEALDTLRRILNRLADRVHAVDRPAHRLAALVRDVDRVPGDVGATLRVAGNLLDRLRHLRDGLRRGLRLLRLRLTRAHEVADRRFALLRGGVDEYRRLVDRRDEVAQRFDRVVDRVRDRAGDVLGDRRLHGQVAVGEARNLVEQAQNGLLVAVVLLGLHLRQPPEVPSPAIRDEHRDQQQDRGADEHERHTLRTDRSAGRGRQGVEPPKQIGGGTVEAAARGDGGREPVARRGDRAERSARLVEQRARCGKLGCGRDAGRTDAERRILAAQPANHLTEETLGVVEPAERLVDRVSGVERAEILPNALKRQLEPRDVNLVRRDVGRTLRRDQIPGRGEQLRHE